MTNRVNGSHHGQTKAQANAKRRHFATGDGIDHYSPRSGKDQQEGAEEFRSIEPQVDLTDHASCSTTSVGRAW